MPDNWMGHHCKCSKETGPANRSSGSWDHITPRRLRKYTSAGLDRDVDVTEWTKEEGKEKMRKKEEKSYSVRHGSRLRRRHLRRALNDG
jgi:hypothetical protein